MSKSRYYLAKFSGRYVTRVTSAAAGRWPGEGYEAACGVSYGDQFFATFSRLRKTAEKNARFYNTGGRNVEVVDVVELTPRCYRDFRKAGGRLGQQAALVTHGVEL